MQGKSHLLVGLTAAVVFDSVLHVTGDPLTMAKTVPLTLLVNKAIFYFAVGFGALLPDIDNARSTFGHKLGWISKSIQHIAGHRTLFHSILGLLLGSLLGLGVEALVSSLLLRQGLVIPAQLVSGEHVIFIAVVFGCIMHIAADAMTEGGVPLFWPSHKRYGFPPNPHWRFRTGTWPEFVVVYGFMFAVGIAVWLSVVTI